MFLNRAREPYEPNMSAAMMTPPVNFTPSTDVPVTMGLLWTDSRFIHELSLKDFNDLRKSLYSTSSGKITSLLELDCWQC